MVPRGRRYVKNMHTTGTVFVQGPSIVLPVQRCIMFNDSYLRACMKLRIVQKIRFSLLESGRTKAWCTGLLSRPSAKAQEPVARSRGLVIQPPKLSVGAYFELSFLGMVSLFIFQTGPTALDSETRGRRFVKNMGHDRNRRYSRAIHCPTSMEKHYVQWFLLKSVQDIMVCEKIRFCLLESRRTKPWCPGGPSHGARDWCLGRVPKHRNQWQEVEGLLFSPKNSMLVHIFSFHSQGVVS